MSDLGSLISGLSIVDDNKHDGSAAAFADELAKTEFSIFENVADLGYFSWKPNNDTINDTKGPRCYKALKSLKSVEEVHRHVDLEGTPDLLVSVKGLHLPKRFESPRPQQFVNKYPYGQLDIVCLHVASQHRGLNLNTVDFAFGGSTLEMLANKDASSPYIATLVPGTTKCILVVKNKEYTQNLADLGFQFERFVTGKGMAETPSSEDIEFVEHMHLTNVGKYKVLFRAETDALDADGSPVEIKASNPRYWGTKVMFQMISSGSTKLCHGEKSRGTLTRVTLRSLSTLAKEALEHNDVATLQKNILDCMSAIQSQIQEGEVRKISFVKGSLQLTPTSGRTSAVLPPDEIVKSLTVLNKPKKYDAVCDFLTYST